MSLLIHVSEAKREQRPVYLNDLWELGTRVRAGEGGGNVSAERARRMMPDRDELQDRMALTEYRAADLYSGQNQGFSSSVQGER